MGSVGRLPSLPTLTFGLPKFDHVVPCGQGYDWPSLVTIRLELATGSCSQTYTPYRKRTYPSFRQRPMSDIAY